MRDCTIARLHDCTVFTFRSPTAPTMSTVDIAMKSGIVQASRIAVAVDELDLVHAAQHGAVDELDLVHAAFSEEEFGDDTVDSRVGGEEGDRKLQAAFSKFDADGDGVISRDEFKVAMHNLGEDLTDEDVDAVMKKIGADGDQQISFGDFKALVESL